MTHWSRRYTAEDRAKCVERSMGRCEACHERPAEELDHFWGRGKAVSSLRTMWLICRQCRYEKTNNEPNRVAWLMRFIQHAERYGYEEQVVLAAQQVEWCETKQALTEQMRRGA